MSIEPRELEDANHALGLSKEASNWLGDQSSVRLASGTKSRDQHWSQEIKAWTNVVGVLSIADTLRASDELVGLYHGESFWSPAVGADEMWRTLFSPLHAFLGLPALEGVEWWLRRCPARFGKPFHFDKDEKLFAFNGQIACPLLTTVLYLTHGGATLILDFHAGMDPAFGKHAKRLFRAMAEPGKLLAFPGNRCHAVTAEDLPFDRQSLVMNWWSHHPREVESRSWNLPLEHELPRSIAVEVERFDGTVFS